MAENELDPLESEVAEYRGEPIQYMKTQDGKYKIVRVMSTDPQVYLKQEFQPGKEVKDSEEFHIKR